MRTRRDSMRFALLAAAAVACAGVALAPRLLSVGAASAGALPATLDLLAPELQGGPWLNTPHGQPVKLAQRRGKVTIVEFWTFG